MIVAPSSTRTGAPVPRSPRSLGIAMRIGLLCWLTTVVTLLIFVTLHIPQQKKTFLRDLRSMATNVASSLREAAASAAISKDFTSVVLAAQTLIDGNSDIEYLVVAQNDGYAIFVERNGWRVEPVADPHWFRRARTPDGEIHSAPQHQRRVFHFGQPFDYSGIAWGWIHVGLSPAQYDRNLSILYRNTLLLALACILFSLPVSLLWSRHLVRPILDLRRIVRRLADGDLSARAQKRRSDELGALAESVNRMTEALLRRDHILDSVRFAAQQYLHTTQWEQVMPDVLRRLGQAAEVSRAYIFLAQADAPDGTECSLRHEWVAPGIEPQIDNPGMLDFCFARAGFGQWDETLAQNEACSATASEVNPAARAVLASQNIRSLIVIPVFVEGKWWGVLGLDDCVEERTWTDAERDSLRAAADMLGATIARQRFQDALLEAKATLEQRVQERTGELAEQVEARQRALTELAAAQSSLLEASRVAGMAEVATGVLHNVGNVLNSVNVSCTLLLDQLGRSRVGNVAKVAEMLDQAREDLARFVSEDARGRQIPDYLASLAEALGEEHRILAREAEALRGRIDHIKEIVAMQQSYGRVLGVSETIGPEQLMEDALKLHAESLARHGVTVERHYAPIGPITVDKHAVLQILLNLIHNAKYACADNAGKDKTITLRIEKEGAERVRFQVSDNGVGITAENMTRIFQHGFTTRKSGHGYGLHSGAVAARQLGGRLSVHSDGPGAGATFTLELPCRAGENL